MEKDNKNTNDSIKKLVITGPECTGKSALSELLARHYQTVWVPEYAREYVDNLDRPYNEADLPLIARGQLALEDEKTSQANTLLVCDTDLIVIKIWSEYKYGYCDQSILDAINDRDYDLYLLTYIDIPWEDDPLREHPHLRQYFYDLFRSELEKMKIPYVEIKGDLQARKITAVKAIDGLLNRCSELPTPITQDDTPIRRGA